MFEFKKKYYIPNTFNEFELSRSKIDLFLECPRCFYLDRRFGISRPSSFPLTLNNAVDTLLKREFDDVRNNKEPHPLMKKYNIDAIPIDHKYLDNWRKNFEGIRFKHTKTNLIIFGAIDDLWQNKQGEYIVVDYKATSKNKNIIELDEDWQIVYKRQIEIYQWLIMNNGLKISNIGYILYCNANTNNVEKFNNKLEFEMTLVPHEGNIEWIDKTINDIYECLNKNTIPKGNENCKYCTYVKKYKEFIEKNI